MDDSWTKRVMEVLAKPGSSPMNRNELARALGVPPEERRLLRAALRMLVADGRLVEGRGGRYSPRARSRDLLTGTLIGKPGGGALFLPDPNDDDNRAVLRSFGLENGQRIPLNAAACGTALHGDRVTVKVAEASERFSWGHRGQESPSVQAKVVRILERGHEHIPGTLTIRDRRAWVTPDDPLLPPVDISTGPGTKAKSGDKVVVSVEEWPARGMRPRGRITERLGSPDEKGVDILGVICRYGLPRRFPPEVLREAEAFPDTIQPKELAGREDWRDRHIVTIDPFDAKDFDDAIGVRELPDGGFELAVHIADVSHYVRPGSALDREARARGNSTYLVDRVIPMLPERLSNNLCSLRPDEDRLTRAAILTYDKSGRRTGARFVSAVIRSRRRFTYEEAYAAMKDTRTKDPDALLLQLAWRLASRLRSRRYRNGSLDLDFPEIKILLDENGNPVRFAVIEYDESHQLIEEFMLEANQAVAAALLRSGRPGIYRIHDDPDPEKLEEFRQLLLANGIPAGDLIVRREMQRVIAAMKGRPEEPILKLSLLRSLKRAVYSTDAAGHYGLAFRHYTHFTSPIRRYADLLVHRMLWNLDFAPGSPGTIRVPDAGSLRETAEHISLTERNSADAEMQSRRIKELQYFENLAKQPDAEPVQLLVTRVLPFGLFVEAVMGGTRGLVRTGDLGVPDIRYDHGLGRMISRSTGREFKAGDRLAALPCGIERERGTVLFRIVGDRPPAGRGAPKQRTSARKRGKRQDSRAREKPSRTSRRRR